ncbi:exodeoxyribonuclease VII small subunit [Paludibacter sp.]
MKNKEITYTDAKNELEEILKQLEKTEEINIDKISSQVKRASELIDFCRKQLQNIDKDLEKMINDIEI